jgi:hypothetical protein
MSTPEHGERGNLLIVGFYLLKVGHLLKKCRFCALTGGFCFVIRLKVNREEAFGLLLILVDPDFFTYWYIYTIISMNWGLT